MMLLGRRKKEEAQEAAVTEQQPVQPVAPVVPETLNDDIDDDLLLDDDLFGESDSEQLFGDETELDGKESDEDDVFAAWMTVTSTSTLKVKIAIIHLRASMMMAT